jgi:hypothetical protein
MFLNNALAVMGVFFLGASAGALLQSLRWRSLVRSCRQLLENAGQPYEADPIGCSTEKSPAEATVLSNAEKFVLPFSARRSVSTGSNLTRFEKWSEALLTSLGAPIFYGEEKRKLTMAERVEWLQARIG